MIILSFPKSRSSKLKEAVKHAKVFDNLKSLEDSYTINLTLKEIIEKWDSFNLLFWIVVDWKGTTIAYDNMTYHSHSDKTKIFYSLQFSKQKFISYTEVKVKNEYIKTTVGHRAYIDSLDGILDDYISDLLIDVFTEK